MRDKYKRLMIAGGIAVLAALLLGIDFPEHDHEHSRLSQLSREYSRDIPPDQRGEFNKLAEENPLLVLMSVAE